MIKRVSKATDEYATSETVVWWDMDNCPLPNGYEPSRLAPRIDTELKNLGYSGPLTIVAGGNLYGIPYDFLKHGNDQGDSEHGNDHEKSESPLLMSKEIQNIEMIMERRKKRMNEEIKARLLEFERRGAYLSGTGCEESESTTTFQAKKTLVTEQGVESCNPTATLEMK